MNPLLEVNPAACLFVIGPQLSHKSARNSGAKSEANSPMAAAPWNFTSQRPPATYSSILDAGLSFLSSKLSEEKESDNVDDLAQIKEIAADEGPTNAMERLVGLMKRKNYYSEWLRDTFGEAVTGNQLFLNSSRVDENSTEEQPTATRVNANSQTKVAAADLTMTDLEIGSFQHLLSLQKQGALLACTQYDTTLDSIAGVRPLTLHDTETLKQWSKLSTLPEAVPHQDPGHDMQRKQQRQHPVGILHLHGVCINPGSIRLTDYRKFSKEEGGGELEASVSPDTTTRLGGRNPIPVSSEDLGSIAPGMEILREIFRKRLVIFVGYDRDYFDPLLPGLLQMLYPDNEPGSLKNPPILLTSMPLTRQLSVGKQLPSTFLTLMVTEEEIHNLSTVISSGSPKNFTVGKGLTDKQASDGLKVQAFLLFNEKQSFRKLGDIIYQQSKSGEIYVRRDALTVIFDDNKILYGNLVTYGGNGLRQLWKLVFSKGSTLLGKGLMALGLQNAAIIWTNRKPAELGNVTGINSVHTYAAHKAVHTMALAQQQYSSSNSIIQSAAPSSVVVMENNTVTPHRTAVTPTSQKLSPQTSSPLLQQVASGQPAASPSKDSESGNEGRGERDHSREREQRGEGRPRKGKERRTNVSIASTVAMVTSSNSDSSPAVKHQTATSSNEQRVIATASPLTTVAASNPPNFLLPGTTPALISPPMSSPALPLGGLNLSALPTAPLTIGALSNQVLAGLPGAAITATGISTPTGGLLSPILFGNNPFLTVLGSSPSLSTAAAASQPAAASILQATAATLNQPAAQAGMNVGGINLQLIKRLQEQINAHLQASPSNQRGNSSGASASVLATATGGFGRTPLQQALLASGLDHGLSKRERMLESLLLSKTPVYCIASPPEMLASDALPSEHTIEYIDTQRITSNSRRSSGNESRCSEREPVAASDGGNLDRKEVATGSRGGQSSRAVSSQNLISSNTTEGKVITSLIKDPAGGVSNNTHLLASPSLTVSHSLLPKTTQTSSLQTPTAAGGTSQVLSRLSLNATPSPFSLPTTAQIQQTSLPLLSYAAAVPPTTAATLTPTLPSPLKGYYIMLNPLATAAAGAAAAGGATAVQPIMIAAAAGGTAAASPTVCGGTTAIQVPALTAAASLNLPSLATSLTSPAIPSPMYCYLPAAAATDGSSHHLTAVQAAAVNSALTAQAAAPLAVPIGGVVEAEKDKELERNHGIHSTSLQIAKAKKRLRNDSTGLNEAKRIRVDTEGTQVDSEDEGGAIECATASESDDEGIDKVSVHGGENCKTSGYKGHLQLWEFLLDLLLTPNHGSIIQWTGNEYEFNIVNPEAVVGLWGAHKNKPQMTYDKMSRSLRYYYSQGIMDKVPGKRYTFKFAFDIQKYIIENKRTSLFTLTS